MDGHGGEPLTLGQKIRIFPGKIIKIRFFNFPKKIRIFKNIFGNSCHVRSVYKIRQFSILNFFRVFQWSAICLFFPKKNIFIYLFLFRRNQMMFCLMWNHEEMMVIFKTRPQHHWRWFKSKSLVQVFHELLLFNGILYLRIGSFTINVLFLKVVLPAVSLKSL